MLHNIGHTKHACKNEQLKYLVVLGEGEGVLVLNGHSMSCGTSCAALCGTSCAHKRAFLTHRNCGGERGGRAQPWR